MYKGRNNSFFGALLQKASYPGNWLKQTVILSSYNSIETSQPKRFLTKKLSASKQKKWFGEKFG